MTAFIPRLSFTKKGPNDGVVLSKPNLLSILFILTNFFQLFLILCGSLLQNMSKLALIVNKTNSFPLNLSKSGTFPYYIIFQKNI